MASNNNKNIIKIRMLSINDQDRHLHIIESKNVIIELYWALKLSESVLSQTNAIFWLKIF